MRAYALLNLDRERLRPFFDRVPELFHAHHHSEDQDPLGYEELLYRIYKPYNGSMLDMIDRWAMFKERDWREDVQLEVMLFLYAIRYPDSLLLESLSEKATKDVERISTYLHFTHHTYAIWDDDSRRGLCRLGIEIPPLERSDPYIYGAYISAIELLKEVAPFTSFLEHDVPRQRLFQAALAAYGREDGE
jgi:hypothetical protein